jgi:hypothetical protein
VTAGGGEDLPRHLSRDTAALFTTIANGDVLAAICALNGCRCDVIEIRGGTLAVLVNATEGAAARAARGVSLVAKEATMLAMERRAGQLSVVRFKGGVEGETLPPGLALDQAPEAVVSLMTGAVTIEELIEKSPGRVHSGRFGRMRAVLKLRKLAREGKRQVRERERRQDPPLR